MMNKISRRALGALTLVGLLAMTGCANLGGDRPAATTAEVLTNSLKLSTFHKLVHDASLQDTLRGPGPITVFAPTDEAFKEVPAATLDKLAKDPAALKALLNYHMVAGAITSKSIEGSTTLTTLNGAKMNVAKAGDFVTVDDGLVVQADIPAGNGVVHIIDRVLTPPKK